MEAKPSNIVLGNGGEIKLPIGFRFRPTDKELLVHYLKRKVMSVPLPALVVPELDLLRTDPRSLPGDVGERRHFFSKMAERRTSSNLHRKRGRAFIRDGSGYWKFTGKEKQIVASGSDQVIGMRRNLTFCQGKNFDNANPQWIMHELRLLGTQADAGTIPSQEGGEWAVYRVFQKRRKQPKHKRGNGVHVTNPTATVIDFTMMGPGSDPLPPPPPSPCSSSSAHSQGEEISTAFGNFSP